MRVFDPFEEELPQAGVLMLNEIETGRLVEVDTRSKIARQGWTLRARERKEHLLEVLARARVDHIDLPIDKDIAAPLIEFFRRRTVRHGGIH